jgi:hypothetical protein
MMPLLKQNMNKSEQADEQQQLGHDLRKGQRGAVDKLILLDLTQPSPILNNSH